MQRRLRPVRVSAPAVDLITLAEAKAHLRVDGTDEDQLIGALVGAAIDHLDGHAGITGRALVTQTWAERFAHFEYRMRLAVKPVQSVSSVVYFDNDGIEQTVPADVYRLHEDAVGAYLVQREDKSWPSTASRDDAVTITVVAGFGDAATDVDQGIRHAALMLIGHWYEQREAVALGAQMPVPFGVSALLSRWRRSYAAGTP